jgi:amino acid adenylation domain-containing protein
MTQELLAELNRRGIKLRLADGRMDVLAPAGSLTAELRERLKGNRDQLIALLREAESGGDLPEITPRPGELYEPFALTDIQHAYWVGRSPAAELGGVGTHYYVEIERQGLDLERLAQSLRLVIDRHDMLRAVVKPDGLQRILSEVPDFQIQVADLRALSPRSAEAELARIRGDMGSRVPTPESWPLFEICASLLAGNRVRLHFSVNMLIADAFSLELMFQDWRRFYTDQAANPGPLPISYRDYVLATEQLQQTSRFRKAEQYWRERIDNLPPAPALPMARRPAQLAGAEFTGRAARLAPERWDAIKRVARTRGLTDSVVLMTVFADVLRAWSGQPDFTLNLTFFDRPPLHPRIGDVVGDFTSLIMLAVTGTTEGSFAARALALQQQLMRDLEHSSYSGVRVLRDRARRMARGQEGATMPVVFTSALALSTGGQPAGRQFFGEFVYSISQTPQVWLDLQVSEEGGELLINADAVDALFPAGLLDDLFAAYLRQLDLLGDGEHGWDEAGQVHLPGWQIAERARANATAADIGPSTLCELAEASAAHWPDAVAVIAGDGQLSYAEVAGQARRLARRLIELGAAAGGLVAVVLGKSRDQVPAVLGICESGAAYLPVDPAWPYERRRQVLDQGEVTIAVTSASYRDELTWPPGITVITLADPHVQHFSSEPLTCLPCPDDLAYVIFTSGSTGQPKGVMIDHRGAANTIIDINRRFCVGPGDRVLAVSSLTFDLSVYDIFGMLAAGGAIVMPPAGSAGDAAGLTALAAGHGVTIWNSVPALMQAWLDDDGPPLAWPASRLRLVMLSGDLIPVALPDQVRATFPGAEVISLGGATEASIWSVWYPIGDVQAHWTAIPYGRPLANQTLHVYDEQLASVPVWTTGELYIGGVGVARGYWRDAEKTAQRFIIHPLTGERLYRTGDLARYRPGGDLDFLGRADFQVKLNGHRIELGEIAAALRRCAGVRDALADLAVNPVTGRKQLVGYVVPAADHEQADQRDGGPDQAGWSALMEAGAAGAREAAAGLGAQFAVFEQWWQLWEELSPLVIARTLAQLGEFTAAGQRATAEEIVGRHGLKAQYGGLVGQWLSVLAGEGVEPTGRPGEYQCGRGLDAGELDRRIAGPLARLAPLLADADPAGGDTAFTGYLRECADHQVELLRGEVSPLQLLMPDDDGLITDALYASNPVSRVLNQAAAALARARTDLVNGQHEPARPVRMLEIGAGTGATSAQILRVLPPDRVSYRFSDISTFFTHQAERDFAAYPFVSFSRYDIDREPLEQGIAPGSVDIIIAANVLHDARNLARTLGYLRRALAPGGMLIAIEGTANTPIQLISFGFLEGFAHYEGSRSTPLLSVPGWREQLAAAGFARFSAVPDGEPVTTAMMQHVLVAQAPSGRHPVDSGSLREALEALLPGYMVPQQYLLIDRIPLTANGKIDRAALPRPWDDRAAVRRTEPADVTERMLLEIWQAVLGRDDFGVEDNFFELGGDSLHALRVFRRMRDELGLDQNADEGMQALFDSPTVAAFAATLPERRASS